MKYLLVLAVVAIAVGIWRSQRTSATTPPHARPRPLAPPHDMVACAHCGVHVPRSEALVQGRNAYCCAEHQSAG